MSYGQVMQLNGDDDPTRRSGRFGPGRRRGPGPRALAGSALAGTIVALRRPALVTGPALRRWPALGARSADFPDVHALLGPLDGDLAADYVRQTEPRSLYIHHEDHGTYASTQLLWSRRSDECKRRWPSEQLAAADGAAGGFTHDYNANCDAVYSVKNADRGYNAAHDCLVALVSPSYTAADESDEIWDKQLQYWATVRKLLKYRKNVCLGFREQFLRGDNHQKRILEMSQALGTRTGGPGLFLFSVSPASLYEMGPLFAPVPAAMSKLNEGDDVVYYMCGRIFQEPLILLNASHMWNTDSLGAIAVPKTASECYPFCNSPVYQAHGTWADKEATFRTLLNAAA